MNGAAEVAGSAPSGLLKSRLDRVDVLVVNYNAGDWLVRTVQSIRPQGADEPNLIVVDNGSSDDSLQRLFEMADPHPNPPPHAGEDFGDGDQSAPPPRADKDQSPPRSQRVQKNLPPPPAGEGRGGGEDSNITVDRAGRNLGFAAGINRAAGQAKREFLLLLNPDCLIDPDTLARLVDELDNHPEAALVSGKVLDMHGREQRGSRRRLPTPSRIVNEMLPLGGEGLDTTDTPAPNTAIEVEAVSGACMLVRRSAFLELDGMDEAYPLHFEDLDLFARLAESGRTLRWVPDARIVHAGGRSSSHRPVAVLWAKHRGLWRYLGRHCNVESWPRWQRPLWLLALVAHAAVRTPLVWAASRLRAAK